MCRRNILFLSIVFLISTSIFAEHGKWEEVANDRGVQVFNRQRSDNMKEFKAITYVRNVKLSTLLAIMDDTDNYKSWMGGVVKSHLVQKINQFERISYTMIDAPWPVADRDNVSYSKVTQNKEDKSIYIHMEARPNALPVTPGVVRVPKSGGYFLFKPIQNQTIMIVYQQYSDPGGSIPQWVQNMAGNKMPIDSLSGMVKLTQSPKYQNAKFAEVVEPW